MDNNTPIVTALEAEAQARARVTLARKNAANIKHQSMEKARQIEQRTQQRILKGQEILDGHLDTYRTQDEKACARAIRELRREALDPDIMARAITSLIGKLLPGPHGGNRS
ncbi:MAG: hypothetical protein OEZ23_06955 [Gammaproteobacteria bacterium]|nr:hypothetical protein [Gammaproteobacteria bacterium]